MPLAGMSPLPGMTYADYIAADSPCMDIEGTAISNGLTVGDLVTYSGMTYSNCLTLFRIVKDCSPRMDAVWGELGRQRRWCRKTVSPRMGWVKPGTRTAVPYVRLRGCVEIAPAFRLIDGVGAHPSKRAVSYENLWRIKKVDVLALGESFARYQDFIRAEVRSIQEST